MDLQVSRKNLKQLYRDQANKFYIQLLNLVTTQAEGCDEARRKELAVEKAITRNATANSQLATLSTSLSKNLEEVKRLEHMKIECTSQLNRHTKKAEEASAKLADIRLKINQINKNSQESKDRTSRQLQPYHDFMGITFERVKADRSLRLMFQLPNSKPCLVTIVNKDSTLKVTKCIPMLKDLDKLEAKLVETNDFAGFVIHLHTLFRTSL